MMDTTFSQPVYDAAETYRETQGGAIRLSDGAFVPEAKENSAWRAYLAWRAAGNAPEPAPEPAPPRPEDISDRQFAMGLWSENLISFDECQAFVSSGVIPAALQTIIDALPDDDTGAPTSRKQAIIFVAGAKTYVRDHPLVEVVRQARGWSPAELDARWRAWAGL